ncbi:restriction endonuclease subunit S [Veillonella sp.]|jgi:hypothetical protein|uniref:restriction endonuclease subunit S n=1 Tax=Veillonella sp. TaxID=1926307 RepID=UPI00258D3B2E|nr:restriction endonuclease subunit S [Veillonella sp.]MDU4572616.1 restriction endonuclease subunit S [Veillonella sp.]
MTFIELGELCDKGTSNLAQKDLLIDSGRYPVYGAAGEITKVDFYQQSKPYLGIVKDGAGVGRVMRLPSNSSVIGTLQYIFPKENVDIKYLYYLIKYLDLGKSNTGATIPHIYFKDYKKRKVRAKSYNEQKYIGKIFELIDGNLITYNRILECYDLLIKSRFDELFLDTHAIETIEIGELFEVGSSKRILQSELTAYGVPFYRVTDLINRINDRAVDIKQYVDELKYMTLIKDKYVPQAGDFLITARGTIGEIYEVKQNDRFYFQDGMITWLKRKNNYINSLFFMELVKTDWFKRQFYSSNNGTTISYLSITDTRHLKVFLPSINLQKQFAQEVNQINKLKFG